MPGMDRFEDILTQETEQVNGLIERYLPGTEGLHATLLKAMNYSIQVGGKRLRPMMIGRAYRLFGGTNLDVAGPFMAAMEMIHTHSLVHDDLPAMDNDRYRRGKETTHVVYGEAMAILAGDGLLNLAYETACRAFAAAPGDPSVGRAMCILARKAGINGMIGGQSVDVEFDGRYLDEQTLRFVYERKTGALIEGSLMIGAALAGADDHQLRTLERVGLLTGVAFQIQDDILDVAGDEALLGKPLHSDEKNHKTTYVSGHGIEASRQKVCALSDEAVELLDGLGTSVTDLDSAAFLRQLILSLAGREK